MLNVDLLKIREFFNTNLKTKEIAELSGLAYTTTDNLRKGITNLENASFRTLVKLTTGYEKHLGNYKNPKLTDTKKLANAELAIKLNDIDGNVLSEEYIEKYYACVNGKISQAELNEYVMYQTN